MNGAGGLAEILSRAGLDLCGALSPRDHDARVPDVWRCAELLPGTRTVLVIGSGGRSLWQAAARAGVLGALHPLDALTARALGDATAFLRSAGHDARAALAHEQRGGQYADLVALAAAAGIGAPSRLGLLVHPVYGPWLSLRALLFTSLPLPESRPDPAFDPCTGCPAPCADACHGSAVPPSGFSVRRCAATRRVDPRCALRCDARHACVLGREHAYEAAAEGHHMRHALGPVLESGGE